MDPTIIVAILSVLGTFGGSLLGIMQANKLVVYRIVELEKKVEKHNSMVERMAVAEKDIEVVQNDVNECHNKIRTLETHQTS